MEYRRFRWLLATLLLTALFAVQMLGQTIVTGDVTGTVTDPSGAVVSGATVTLKSATEGTTQTTTTNQTGAFRFALLKPGEYKLTVSQKGFKSISQTVQVALGQITTANSKLEMGSQSEVLEVTGAAPIIQTENANISSSVNQKQIDQLPNGGNDMTYVAQTSPGVLMNTASGNGYGNFVAFGLPATSNLFTVNGNDEMDPYLNLNNSGATNLLLGKNEVQEAAVVSNGYTGQYGRQAGAQVDYATKSGTNSWHGNMQYWWNGSKMNANDWFANENGVARPFVNNNQWAASFGGPIKKDKAFFFVDTEGVRYILATSQEAFVPDTAFSNAVIANLNSVDAAAVPFYQRIFNLYQGAPGFAGAALVDASAQTNLGCGDLSNPAFASFGDPANGGGGTPCARVLRSTVGSPSNEWTVAARTDFNLTNNDKLFLRFKSDRGTQPTSSDPINPLFSASSFQPQWEGQANYTRTINPTTINQFVGSVSWYQAIFDVNDRAKALAAFPYFLIDTSGAAWGPAGGGLGASSAFPQGRKVTQYQLTDDLSMTRGSHEFKTGFNFRRNDISDYWFGRRTIPQVYIRSMDQFVDGLTGRIRQYFSSTGHHGEPMAIYSVGFYFQDTWRVKPNLKLTLTARADRNSNMVCQTNCISNMIQPFAQSPHDDTIPFNQLFVGNQHRLFQGGLEKLVFQPRFGFAWNPWGKSDLVLRGGIGLFSDLYPASLVDSFATNAPNFDRFVVKAHMPLSPDEPGNAESVALACQAAFQSTYQAGGTLADYQAIAPAGCANSVPDYNSVGSVKNPKFLEWNFEVQKSIGQKTSLSVNYVGNRGYDIFMFNQWANASQGFYPVSFNVPASWSGLPANSPDNRVGNVGQLTNDGYSNYNGVTLSVARRLTKGFQGQVNYTWSHAMDTVSNGGISPFSINDSVLVQLNPGNLRTNDYSNADYDIRHNLTASYVWDLPFKSSNGVLNQVVGGWSFSGTFFARSRLPYTATDDLMTLGGVLGNALNSNITAQFTGGSVINCDRPGSLAAPTQCLDPATQFTLNNNAGSLLNTGLCPDQVSTVCPIPTGFSTTRRNSFRGPKYFNTDFSVLKRFKVTERANFAVGANFFNIFNHPNFANPNSDVNNILNAPFGQITTTITPPTSIYGAFFGSAVSGRLVQLHARIEF